MVVDIDPELNHRGTSVEEVDGVSLLLGVQLLVQQHPHECSQLPAMPGLCEPAPNAEFQVACSRNLPAAADHCVPESSELVLEGRVFRFVESGAPECQVSGDMKN